MQRVVSLHAKTLERLASETGEGPRPRVANDFLLTGIREACAFAPDAADRLVDHYGRRCPEAWIQRLHQAAEPIHELVRLDLGRAEIPRFRAALTRLFAGARAAGLDAEQLWGVSTAEQFLTACPRIVDLLGLTLFGSCLPMVSLGPLEQQAGCKAVAEGWSLADLFDLRFAGALLHELAHGPVREWAAGPGCSLLLEAAAAVVNLECQPDHVFATRPGEPVLGLRNAMVLGQALVDELGSEAVWRLALSGNSPESELGRHTGHALAAASWQEWAATDRSSFQPRYGRVLAWAKLFTVCRADRSLLESVERLEQASSVSPALAMSVSDLLAEADAVPWSELPAWHESPASAHRASLSRAVHSLFHSERLQPDLQAVPVDPAGGRIVLDFERCEISTPPLADDPFGLVPGWRLPPALCRVAVDRGARRLVLRGCTLGRRTEIVDRIWALCEGSTPLSQVQEVDLRAPEGKRRGSRTPVDVDPPDQQLHHSDPVLALGSCFATHMGRRLQRDLFEVHDNPFGILYDPMSVARATEWVTAQHDFPDDLLFLAHGRWHSDWHHTDLSNADRDAALAEMSARLHAARTHQGRRSTWLLTWGTAWVWERLETGEIVANCHGLSAKAYNRRLLEPSEIVDRYGSVLERLCGPDGAHVVLTVSPIRHLASGPIDNQTSKSTLHLAANELARQHPEVSYFPAYEIVLDELRDYRWYTEDLVHVSEPAADSVYERFLNSYVAPASRELAQGSLTAHRELVGLPRDPVRRLASLHALSARIDGFPRAVALPSPEPLRLAVGRMFDDTRALLAQAVASHGAEASSQARLATFIEGQSDPLGAVRSALRFGKRVAPNQTEDWVAEIRGAIAALLAGCNDNQLPFSAVELVRARATELHRTSALSEILEVLLGAVLQTTEARGSRPDSVDLVHDLLLTGVPAGRVFARTETLALARPVDLAALADRLSAHLVDCAATGRRPHQRLPELLARMEGLLP